MQPKQPHTTPSVCMRQQLGSCGLTHAAKSSSHDAAGDATYVSCGRCAAAEICATSESWSQALPPHTAATSGEVRVMLRSSTTYITGGPILANFMTSLHQEALMRPGLRCSTPTGVRVHATQGSSRTAHAGTASYDAPHSNNCTIIWTLSSHATAQKRLQGTNEHTVCWLASLHPTLSMTQTCRTGSNPASMSHVAAPRSAPAQRLSCPQPTAQLVQSASCPATPPACQLAARGCENVALRVQQQYQRAALSRLWATAPLCPRQLERPQRAGRLVAGSGDRCPLHCLSWTPPAAY